MWTSVHRTTAAVISCVSTRSAVTTARVVHTTTSTTIDATVHVSTATNRTRGDWAVSKPVPACATQLRGSSDNLRTYTVVQNGGGRRQLFLTRYFC